MWKRAAKRPSTNIQVQGFLASCVEMWIGIEEITKALGISAWQMRNWRKRYGCLIVTLPSGNVALSKELFRRWLLVLGKNQLEATNRYREEKIDPETGEALTDDTE
jgi:hypothetical protein